MSLLKKMWVAATSWEKIAIFFLTLASVMFYCSVVVFSFYADRDLPYITTYGIEYFPLTRMSNYTLMMMMAMFLSYHLLIKKKLLKITNFNSLMGKDKGELDWMFLWMVAIGFVGASLVNVITSKRNWFNNPHEGFWRTFIEPWHGGIAIEGGMMFGTIGGYLIFRIIARLSSTSVLKFGDVVLPHILLAQAIGRWGNFFNQEVLGQVVESSWLMWLPRFVQVYLHYPYEDGSTLRHPFFLYESILNVLNWCFLVYVLPKLSLSFQVPGVFSTGFLAYSYFFLYGVVRSSMENFRADIDIARIGDFRALLWLSFLFVGFGLFGMGYCQLFSKKKDSLSWVSDLRKILPFLFVLAFAFLFLVLPILMWLSVTAG